MKTIPVRLIRSARRGMRRAAGAFLLLLALNGAALYLHAASTPPDQMSYQGFLVDGDGNPLAPSTPQNYAVVFRIYDSQEGGAPLWAEQQIVTVDKGSFSVVLGEGTEVTGESHATLSSVFQGSSASERYLGMTVTIGANNLNLLPRIRLLPAPYSFLASKAAQLIDPSTGAPFVSLNGADTTIPGNARFGGTVFWGSGSGLTPDNGGSIELGDSINGSPYIDFHHGVGTFQDWNMRMINDADGRLSIYGGRLSLGSALGDTKLAIWDNDNANTLYGFGVQASQFRFHVGDAAARFSFLNSPSGTEVMSVLGNGRVGIGTASPAARLDVRGWVNSSRNFAYYARSVNIFGTAVAATGVASGNVDYSILAERRIGGTEFNAFSDARMKEVVGLSDRRKDLETIQKLQVKDYYFIDRVGNGDALRKGFIAQEVRAVIPEAVTTSKRFIPDIYALPESFEYDSAGQRLAITLTRAHQLKEGDNIQIFVDESRLEVPVAKVISAQKFVVEKCLSKPTELFVFGKEVSDFHILNYDQIFTVGISAIQEMHREMETKDARIASLEREIAGLKKQMAAAAEEDSQWQARFAALEKLVADMAAGRDEKITKVAVRQDR